MFYRWYGMLLSNITHEEFLDGARKQELAFLVFPIILCVLIDVAKLLILVTKSLK